MGHLYDFLRTNCVRASLLSRQAPNDDTSRVCITTSLELASLHEYLHNVDKSCGSKSPSCTAVADHQAIKGSALIPPYGDSRSITGALGCHKLNPSQSLDELKHHHCLCTVDETTHRYASI